MDERRHVFVKDVRLRLAVGAVAVTAHCIALDTNGVKRRYEA
tara:strand:+ start:1540 stop:1665 length:126 start_codon:yes stop_codon:yes gene_type:complete